MNFSTVILCRQDIGVCPVLNTYGKVSGSVCPFEKGARTESNNFVIQLKADCPIVDRQPLPSSATVASSCNPFGGI